MNDRSAVLLVIAIALAAYGLYMGSYALAMLAGQPEPLLLILFILQVICAFAAAIGVWMARSWAGGAVIALGISIAATRLVEAFVLGLIPYLPALFITVFAIVGALLIASFISRQRESRTA